MTKKDSTLFYRIPQTISWMKPTEKVGSSLTDGSFLLNIRETAKGNKLIDKEISENDSKNILEENSFSQALKTLGLPYIEGATPEQELIELLKAAAEIEHGLMIQYLYAAYSCSDSNKSISQAIIGIAVEEMGHLLTVQNLLLAMGQNPYLGRYDSDPNENFDPFPFSLEPIDKKVIAKYAACEMPDERDVDSGEGEESDILPDILKDASDFGKPEDRHRIGLLYTKIYWLLRKSDKNPLDDPNKKDPWEGYRVEEVAEEMLRKNKPEFHIERIPVTASFVQAQKSDWYNNQDAVIVESIANTPEQGRESALLAIANVTAQGEGFANEPNGHFDRFVEAYRMALASGSISKNVAKNPWYAENNINQGPVDSEITSKIAIKFSILGDLIYEILLNYIALALHPKFKGDNNRRRQIAIFCVKKLMMDAYRPLAIYIGNLKIQDTESSPELSLCFTLPKGSDELSEIESNLTQKIELGLKLSEDLGNNAETLSLLADAAKDVNATLKSAPKF